MSAGFYWVLFIANGWNESVGFSLASCPSWRRRTSARCPQGCSHQPGHSGLAGKRGSVNTASVQLVLKSLVENTGGLSLLNLAQNRARLLDSLCILLDFADTDAVVLLVPLLERGCIDLDDATLHQGVGADQLVVGGVVRELSRQHLRVTNSVAQEKFPVSRRRARYLVLPPRTRTVRTRLCPILVPAGWRPNSNLRF